MVPIEGLGDDGALVLAVQQGDVAAFDALFRRHYPAVRSACVRRLVDPVEADEAAQAAFVRAFERIAQCTGPRRFGPWVHVIARSLCMDAFRARSRVEPFEEPLADGREHRPNEPEESLLRDERAAHVHEALAALPERQRSAVIARDWDDLRPGEISDRLGVSVGAVDSLLLRARRRMARSYRRLAGEAGGGRSTRTLRAAAAATAVAVLAGPHAVMAASASAADAVGTTASKAAVGVVGAVVSVTETLGATMAPTATDESPSPPDTPAGGTLVDHPVRPPAGPRTGPSGLTVAPQVTSVTVAPPPAPPSAPPAQSVGPDVAAAAPAPATTPATTPAAGAADPDAAGVAGPGPAGATTSTTLGRPVRPVPPTTVVALPAVEIPPLPEAVTTTTVAVADPPPPPPPAVTVAPAPADLPAAPPVTTPTVPTVTTDVARP
ncbi:MAG TPA: sigma-70 family RNA polymerase sigma factor [Acidimicrobiales bacterium]|nr:sigma-70 family RNA polymerase sigma factor [Acidimicrobiales bacterium]